MIAQNRRRVFQVYQLSMNGAVRQVHEQARQRRAGTGLALSQGIQAVSPGQSRLHMGGDLQEVQRTLSRKHECAK
jgi:hypothetical protein